MDHFIAGMSPGTDRDGSAAYWKQFQDAGATEAVIVLYGPPDFCRAGTIDVRSDDIQVSNLVIRFKDAAAATAAYKGGVAALRSAGGKAPIPPQLGPFETVGAATGLGENSYTDIPTDPRLSDPTFPIRFTAIASAQWQKDDLVATLHTRVSPKMSADAIRKAAQAIYSRMP